MSLAAKLQDIAKTALDDWVNGERDTPACTELSELARVCFLHTAHLVYAWARVSCCAGRPYDV